MRDYPKRQLLNAMEQLYGAIPPAKRKGKEAQAPELESSSEEEAKSEEEEALGAFSHRCNAMARVGGKKKMKWKKGEKTAPALTMEPDKSQMAKLTRSKGLMFVDVKINGKPMRVMVDTGTTHNYLASSEVGNLRLLLEKGVGRVKAINSTAQPIAGVAKSVLIKVGPYEGRTNLSVVVMDDFKLILGLDFLRDTKTVVMPHADVLMIMGSKPCVAPTVSP